MRKLLHEITAADVGKGFSRLPGCRVFALAGFGCVCAADVGKRLFDVGGVGQMENAEQRDRRQAQAPKHTPGPWTAYNASNGRIFKRWRVQSGGTTIAELVDLPGDCNVSNAALIAAAPDLLAACMAVADLANGQGRENLMMVAAQARAAIAKITCKI